MADDRSRSEAARQKRQEQLRRWRGSDTDTTGLELRARGGCGPGGRRSRVRFAQGAVFMASCSAGDREEVAELLRQGADINHANVDGLTALHQACIDDSVDMVRYLVENGCDVNQCDNEGWTPLHAAASCGFVEIARYLIAQGAQVGVVNSEGELPLDVAQDSAMERLLREEINRQGVDVEAARRQEERLLLQDALALLGRSGVTGAPGVNVLTPHPKTRATALHVAAAKGYIEAMKVLLQCGVEVDSRDNDGWTPLHAAAHWGQSEACRLLGESLCDMEAQNNVGQTPFDVADEEVVELLEELRKTQKALQSEKQKLSQPPLIETSPPLQPAPPRARRSSISRMSSKEKFSLHDREKHGPPALPSPPPEDEEDEAPGPAQVGGSSSSSSEDDSESESDAESEKVKTREIINNLNNKLRSPAPPTAPIAAGAKESKVAEPPGCPPLGARVAEEERREREKEREKEREAREKECEKEREAPPGSWRTSLRKTGSSGTLGGVSLAGANQEPGRGPDSTSGVTRSASSPRLSSTESDNKEPRTARVPPTPTRRLFSIPDSSLEPGLSGSLARSSSYTRRLNSQSGTDPAPSVPRSSSFGRRPDDTTATSVTTATASSTLSRLNSLTAQRLAQDLADRKDPVPTTTPATTAPVTATAGQGEAKERRRSYLTPVRDEEAEAQRRARSRHARQSRRSTQGVTLTDLQEAEKTIKTEQKEREKKKEEEERERDSKHRRGEEGEVSWRSRIANLQKSDLLGLTNPTGATRSSRTSDTLGTEVKDGPQGGAVESEGQLGIRERRRARRRRAGLGTGESDDNELSGEEEGGGSVQDPRAQVDRYNSRGHSSSTNDRLLSHGSSLRSGSAPETKDYRKLFEQLSRENSQLQSQLQDTHRLVSQTRLDLDSATQRQERLADCSAMLELEKKERRILEHRVSELEEELKVLGDLKADNQRLKDENAALIRVISKLSK
ncbi:protein phosphatase 1 regulatory subunit 12A isoform X2 [Amia ocellicauda]|uniref:protein phosphatase 1 regulatory subunit 12A isoform X2 n=1 Tax=Amia ocellicauda TaxID=2972642 RepID=UPI003464C87B